MSSPEQHQGRSHVSTLRRMLRRLSDAEPSDHRKPLIDTPRRKPSLASSMLLRGLGCASSAGAHVPSGSAGGGGGTQVATSAVREAADWDGKRRRSKKKKKEKKKVAASAGGGPTSADMWCVEASVDCVVERAHRERPCISRRVTVQEQISAYMDSPLNLDAHFFRPDLTPPGRLHRARAYHHHRHHSPPDLDEEMMMYSTRMLFGGSNLYDRHRDWRLDVDHMSYEELLDLEDRIGYVSTGLREEDILGKVRAYVFDPLSLHVSSSEAEKKCSICQEEYEANEEMGKLECGHGYHVYCIKQWLSRKNSCPLCKTSISKS